MHQIVVVYFDQCLGAAHSKRWLKSLFSIFLAHFYTFLQDYDAIKKIRQKVHNFGLFPNAGGHKNAVLVA